MKIILVCVLSFLLVSNLFSADKKTGWEKDGLKGKVKEWVKSDYDIKSGEDAKEITEKSISRYDEKGNKIEAKRYDDKGTMDKISTSAYTYY